MNRLKPQPWMIAPPTRRVIAALEAERPGCARFVGGCVRNALLGEPVADIDIATQLTPDIVERAMRASDIAVHPTGIEHGTLTVVADHQPFEITTLRRDVETDGRRAVVAFTEDWAEDAQRRDFRMNALYVSIDGELFDPTGGGLDDIRDRRIVFVGDPETRLREDYLRILRFFRFNAWYGAGVVDPAGLAACSALKAGLAGISVERIWGETRKLLSAPYPVNALMDMQTSGVLDVLFPEAADLKLLWRLCLLDKDAPDPMRRFLALLPKDGDVVAAVARRLKMSNEERDRLVFAARDETVISPKLTPHELRVALYRSGPVIVGDRAALEQAAGRDEFGDWAGLARAVAAWRRPVMPVDGQDMMAAGVAAGPDVGEALRRLETAWVESDFTLSRDALLALL